ncbi:hypothetical protein V8C44DRAFT_360025 [Trichoderma aethiopicum]
MSAEGKKQESPAVTSYINDFEGDLPCRLVTIVHDDMKQLDTQMENGEAAAAEADDSPISDAGNMKTWN